MEKFRFIEELCISLQDILLTSCQITTPKGYKEQTPIIVKSRHRRRLPRR